MGPVVTKPVVDKIDHLLERAKHKKRGLTDAELAEKEKLRKEKRAAATKPFVNAADNSWLKQRRRS